MALRGPSVASFGSPGAIAWRAFPLNQLDVLNINGCCVCMRTLNIDIERVLIVKLS